jgi:hypothetical protein
MRDDKVRGTATERLLSLFKLARQVVPLGCGENRGRIRGDDVRFRRAGHLWPIDLFSGLSLHVELVFSLNLHLKLD